MGGPQTDGQVSTFVSASVAAGAVSNVENKGVFAGKGCARRTGTPTMPSSCIPNASPCGTEWIWERTAPQAHWRPVPEHVPANQRKPDQS